MLLCDTIRVPMTSANEPEKDLHDLLHRVAAGDRAALAELYRQVEGRVFAFLLSRLGDAEQAADLVHEVMLVVWRRAAAFEGRSRPLTWILGIARHKLLDALRRAGRWTAEPPDEDAPDALSPTPFEQADHRQRRDAVRAALATLSENHREVVHLAFFEDRSYGEIAEIVGIPEGTVKTRMFHAKKALQRSLASTQGGAR